MVQKLEMDKCFRCECASCSKEDCDNWCEMKKHCNHDPMTNCINLSITGSYNMGQAQEHACIYSLISIEEFQDGKHVDWEDLKRVLRNALPYLFETPKVIEVKKNRIIKK
ncbi:MAG: hypothetical protein ACOY46_02875 [Bacillota bacterium]